MNLQILGRVVLTLIATITFVSAAPARAQETAGAVDERAADDLVVRAATTPTRFLPGAVLPEAGSARVSALGWGGYDGATQTPLMGATAEARLTSRIVLGAGAVYAPAAFGIPAAVRPSVVARVQLLDQQRHGLDLGVAAAYREDRFVGEEGFVQATVAVGLHDDRNTLLGNLSYGQDGEGDDFEGELRAAALRRFGERLNLGVDGRFRKSLWSTDARGNPTLEYRVGPVAAYGVGPVAITAAAGWGGVRIGQLESGFVALGGVGAVF
jgi:hypothetical protein